MFVCRKRPITNVSELILKEDMKELRIRQALAVTEINGIEIYEN